MGHLSPPAESMYSPITDHATPSDAYMDPLFYSKKQLPPLPPLSLKHALSFHSLKCSPRPSKTPPAPKPRPLPLPPAPDPSTSSTTLSQTNAADGANQRDEPADTTTVTIQPSPDSPPLSCSRTAAVRPLPRTPQHTPTFDTTDNFSGNRSTSLRRAKTLANVDSRTRRIQRSLPPTPGGPLAPSRSEDDHHQKLPLTAGSEGDLTRWVHGILTSGVRCLPAVPSPRTPTTPEVPPPAYNSIAFNRRRSDGDGPVTTDR